MITSVTLKIRYAGFVGTNPFTTHGNILVDVRKGAFGEVQELELLDFQALADVNKWLVIKNAPVSGWYSGKVAASNLIYINKGGVTQLRLRFAKDDNDDLGMDYIKLYSGNCLTASYRPKLMITYYVP